MNPWLFVWPLIALGLVTWIVLMRQLLARRS
jgi:hypothetical protein